nr:type II secretion system F family protein [Roseomonas acroporae]
MLLLSLAVLTISLTVLAVMQYRSRGRRLRSRLAGMTRPQARLRPPGEAGWQRPVAGLLPAALVRALPAAFGYAPERADQYPAPPAAIIALALLPALLGALYAASLLGGWARLLALPLWLLLARFAFGKLHARRARRLYRQLPDTLAMVVRAVRAGIPVVEALRTVGREVADPTGAEFRRLSSQISIGITLEAALRGLALRSGLSEYAFFAVALTLQNAAGGNLTETLDNLADVVRKRVAMRQRGLAMASQAQASAYILTAVPLVTIGALLLLNPSYILLLFEDPRGNTIVALALASLGCGLGAMRFMINRSLS